MKTYITDRESERKSTTGLSRVQIQREKKSKAKKKNTEATFQPHGTGPAAASQSKKGQNKAKRTSCVSEGQDGNQTERMTRGADMK